jgi:CRP-like cAMP-binding protein
MMNTAVLNTVLFRGMSAEEADEALTYLHAEEKKYRKGQRILRAGQTTRWMGLVLAGSVSVESNDLWGNRNILSLVEPGQFFAETYALLKTEPMLVDVTSNDKSSILFLDIGGLRDIITPAIWQVKIINNLLMISSQKNLHLSGRSFHTAPKTIRGRVMAYLNTAALQKKSASFDIPFDRQQLADYLNVERSALSKELGKMRKDGMIETRKNHFTIISSVNP